MKHFTFWWTMWMWVHLQRPQPKGLVKGLQIPPAFYCLKENSFCEQQYATKLYNDRHWQWSETRFPNFFTVECWKGTSLGSITQKSKSNKNPQCLSQNKKPILWEERSEEGLERETLEEEEEEEWWVSAERRENTVNVEVLCCDSEQ